MKNYVKQWTEITRIIILRFIHEGFTYRVSALTYTTLLALVPFFAVMFYLLSLFSAFKHVGIQVQHYIFTNFVPTTGDVVEQYVSSFVSKASHLPPLGLLALIVVTIMMLITIESAFNDIWQVKARRKNIRAFLRYWLIILIAPMFIGLSFFVSSYLFSLSIFHDSGAVTTVMKSLWSIAPFCLIVIGLTLLNVIVPNCRVKLRHGLLGGVVSAVLFQGAKHVFVLYAINMPSYEKIYGALATIPLFLLWIYISWFIVFIGAMLANVVANQSSLT